MTQAADARALAQDQLDCIKVDPAHHRIVLENEHVRVVRWVVLPGDKTLTHSHPKNLNINLTDYTGKVTTPQKIFDVYDKAGSVSWRDAVIHAVENLGSQPMEGIIVEFKNITVGSVSASAGGQK